MPGGAWRKGAGFVVSLFRRLAQAVTMIGPADMLSLARYTWEKRRLDEAYPVREPFPWVWASPEDGAADWIGPGSATGATRLPRGLRVAFASGHRGANNGDPADAGGDAGGRRDSLSLSFLASDLLEVTWREPLPGLPLPGLGLPERPWPEVAVQVVDKPEGWTLRTTELEARVGRDGRLLLHGPDGRLLREELPPLFHKDRVCHRVSLTPWERIYGLGERAAPVDLRGGAYRLWNRDPGGAYGPGEDPVYLSVPVYLSRPDPCSDRTAAGTAHDVATSCGNDPGGGRPGDAEAGYLAFYANSHPGLVDVGKTDPGIIEHRFAGGGLRYYLALGPAPRALERYAELTGKPPLPPLWALGYHQCRWSYYPDARVRKLAADFARHEIPVDAIHLDIHYMDGYRVFTVDRRRFPDLRTLAHDLAAQGIRLVTIIDPGLKKDPDYRVYRKGLERGMFATLPDGRVAVAPVWPGPAAFPDFSRPEVREWWGLQFRPLLEAGVAGFWQDMNEPSAFVSQGDPTLPLGTRHAAGDHLAAHNLYGLLMSQATDEGLRRLDPERRPFIVSRSGWAGLQRHAWTWTADVRSDWPCLRQTIATVIGLGLSGIPFSGSDVGGFNGRATAELYLRWLQMSAFMPFFRSHTMIGTPDQEPWSYGDPYTAIAREFIRLRYSLLPYFYTLAWEASRHGWPLVRPLFWTKGVEAPVAGGAATGAGCPGAADDCFLLGDGLLVAPVVEEGAISREVPVPAGLWYDYWTGRPIEGPAAVRLDAPLGRIPLLVRAGTVLPMDDLPSGTASRAFDHLHLHLYPPSSGDEGLSRLFTDAGDGYGAGRVDYFRVSRHGGRVALRWEPAVGATGTDGGFPWPYRRTELVSHGLEVRRAFANGAPVDIRGNRVSITPFAEVLLEVD